MPSPLPTVNALFAEAVVGESPYAPRGAKVPR
jgi:hypothetical protein